jgi:hypothetical protein
VNLDSVPFDRMKQFIREGYERGGVITISWHLNNPLTGKSAWDPRRALLPPYYQVDKNMNYIKTGSIK